MTRKVFPVEGRYLNDVPATAHDCDDERCVESGAFTTKRPPPGAATSTDQDPTSVGSSDSGKE